MNATLDQSPDAANLLRDVARAGLYSADEDCACSLYHAGPGAGFNVYRIDFGQVHDLESLHYVLSHSLHFPDWYGANWDGLTDCLTDMSWNEASGYLLILQRTDTLQRAHPEAFRTLMELLGDTARFWREQGTSFWTLIIGENIKLPQLEVHS
jgi:RNAse (barnase) inhibitor barstar